MPIIIEYLLKLSLSLTLVYFFYQVLLRKLTFYNCNRVYLLAYTVACFFIPLINITPTLEARNWNPQSLTNIIPAWQLKQSEATSGERLVMHAPFNYWNVLLFILLMGAVVLLTLFLIRYMSFLRIRRQARLIAGGEMRIYQVDRDIIPFSFGNAIFINHTLHQEDELREIIRHEFVHVRQKHSIDIMWAEFLCMVNWYNPVAWMIRKSIRQNLEFIADEQVLKSGLDKKQYQYMLLEVVGNKHFSIASQFNFSSLKKRIAMMNKVQTSKRHLLRLVLILPAVTVLLFAFRSQTKNNDTIPAPSQQSALLPVSDAAAVSQPDLSGSTDAADAVAAAPLADTTPLSTNKKGYNIMVKRGDVVVVRDSNHKVIKSISLKDWNKNSAQYEDQYGEIPPPPPPPPVEPPPAVAKAPRVPAANSPVPPPPPPATDNAMMPPPPPPPPIKRKLPANVSRMQLTNGNAKVILKDGKTETYDLNDAEQKAQFEKKYGKLPEPPEPPEPPTPASYSKNDPYPHSGTEKEFIARHSNVAGIKWAWIKSSITGRAFGAVPGTSRGEVIIFLKLKNGTEDMYNLGDNRDIERFKRVYGEMPPASPGDGC